MLLGARKEKQWSMVVSDITILNLQNRALTGKGQAKDNAARHGEGY